MIERRDHARLLVSWVSLACSLFFRSLALPISLLQVSFSSSLFFPSLLHLLAFAIVSLLAPFPPSLVPFFPLIFFLYLSIYQFFYLSICLFPSPFSLPFPPVPHSSGSRSPTKRHFSHTEAHLIGLDPPTPPHLHRGRASACVFAFFLAKFFVIFVAIFVVIMVVVVVGSSVSLHVALPCLSLGWGGG